MNTGQEIAEAPRAAPEASSARSPRNWKGLVVGAVFAALLGAFVYGRWFKPIPVRSHVVHSGDVVAEVFGRGSIESEREADLGFDLVGRLSEVLVDEGDRVSLGQALARLYPEQVRADLRAASSGVAAARSSLERLAAEERRARAAADAAEREQRRAAELVRTGAVSPQALDAAEDNLRLARAELDRVLAQRVEATRSIEVAQGGAEQRGATMLRATLLAPFDGLVTRRLREPGDTVTVGTTVLRLVDTEEVYVSAWIDETALGKVREGQTANILLPGTPLPVSGVVRRVGWESDRQTHELLVDVVPTKPLGRVAIGQRADVSIAVAKKDATLSIPLEYVQRDAEGVYCYVDREGRVERSRVELGVVGRDQIEITKGLRDGDTVLTSQQVGANLPLGRRWRRP